MDLRDIVRMQPDVIVGHVCVDESLNLQKEYKRFSADPLANVLYNIGDKDSEFWRGDIGRYFQAYSWYTLCLKRCLEHISICRRVNAEIRYHPKNTKYSARQKRLTQKLKCFDPYLEVDYQNLIIHACILLDRTITLSRRFLKGDNLPSFTSFNKHIDFLKKKPESLKENLSKYQQKIISCSDWYDIPVKVLRDKYLMHSAEKHMSFFGWSGKWDLEMMTIIPANTKQEPLFEKVKVISFSPRRLSRDVEEFLSWFSIWLSNN